MKKAGVKIYFQPFNDNRWAGRVRIIEPNGRTYWTGGSSHVGRDPACWDSRSCCFAEHGMTQAQVIRAMRAYDKDCGFPPAELIGEL